MGSLRASRLSLHERLLAGGPGALGDYELLALQLHAAMPDSVPKPLAKALITRFGSLGAVLGAERSALSKVPGMGDASIAALMGAREMVLRMLRSEVQHRSVIASRKELLDYLTARSGYSEAEELHLLFLDRKNALIADELHQHGTIDHVPIYPREVVKRALEMSASALILAHNHPSGDTTPSRSDVAMTRAVQQALQAIGMQIHDHIIIGRGRHSSFKSLGLL